MNWKRAWFVGLLGSVVLACGDDVAPGEMRQGATGGDAQQPFEGGRPIPDAGRAGGAQGEGMDAAGGSEDGDSASDGGRGDAKQRDAKQTVPDMDGGSPSPGDAAGGKSGDPSPDGGALGCRPAELPGDCAAPADGVLPADLACTGLYGDLETRALACGVGGYAPAYPLYSDGTDKHRFIALPAGSTIDVTEPEHFVFPQGTRFWKEFWIDVDGQPRRAETRYLEKTAEGWLYTTYVWSEDGLSALQENDGVPFVQGSQHSIPSRSECRECHAGRGDFVLGWDLIMLGPGATGLSLSDLREAGRLRVTTDDGSRVPRESDLTVSPPGDDLERAALGYLHANCGVSCHNDTPEAEALDTGLRMRLDLDTLLDAAHVDAVVTAANKLPGIHAKLPPGGPYHNLLPGDPEHSLLLARMAVRDETQMPSVGTNVVDGEGVALIEEWIAAMDPDDGYPAPAPVEDGVETVEPAPDAGPDAGRDDPDAGSDAGADPGSDACANGPSTDDLGVEVVVSDSDLETLSFAAQAPGSDDWYLVEMRGRILRLGDGGLEETPFLDLRSAINLGAGFDQTSIGYDERGLVGLAFAPDYQTSGLFYVTITPSRSNSLGLQVDHDMVLEYRKADGEPPELQRILVDAPSASGFLGNIHNANTVRFGPDDMLYVGMGDGGGVQCGNTEPGAAQDIDSVYGKLLRLDPGRPAPHGALDNPFVGTGDERVLHYGLRNPFRFSFDRQTGDLYLGDVGQDTYEELDFAPVGAEGLNFGWAHYEANARCPSADRPLRAGSAHTPPIFVANRRGSGRFSDFRAIVGGMVYRGTAIPRMQGVYLFGDYYGRRLGALVQCEGGTSPVSVLRKRCDPNFPEACLESEGDVSFTSLTAIVEDHAGELYFVANGDSLLRLIDVEVLNAIGM